MSEQLARDIALLAELFKSGGWSEIRVEGEGISLLLSTNPDTAPLGGHGPAVAPTVSTPPPAAAQPKAVAADAAAAPTAGDVNPDWAPVVAPNLGTFYRSPKPGAPSFVEVGQRVEADTEVCLIEVMKLFTSVKAGIAGTVRHIAAADAALVEGGQILLYIERD
ncbi:acetyl-CoA carboxylase biotin carboxyl carrier protein [Sphingobium sp.]|uniref:acetyl-CoA carboxylase biotin carboxyl carrier protein n=1 Tax=Sphingobium sp. TaxID=1912891 RepID=UPI0028BE4FD9|nr:biotin/lipoyl-containing protein [Sphingobium sp.]